MYNVVVTMIYGDPNDEDAEIDTLLEDNYKNRQDASDAVDDCLFANDVEGVVADDVFDQVEEDCVCSNKFCNNSFLSLTLSTSFEYKLYIMLIILSYCSDKT